MFYKNATPCSLVKRHQRFGEICYLHTQGRTLVPVNQIILNDFRDEDNLRQLMLNLIGQLHNHVSSLLNSNKIAVNPSSRAG
jgi:hypothetical protein